MLAIAATHLDRVDHDQVALGILDCQDLGDARGIVAENEHANGLRRIMRRRLNEGQTAVSNDMANTFIPDAMFGGSVEDPYRQR